MMELDEFLEISSLLDCYRNILTDKQKEYLVNHFEEDLSLTEIAKNNNVSRQAVYDNIKRGIKLLREYEEKLGFHKKEKILYNELEILKKDFKIERLEDIMEKLF